jgi:hypothetical protein
MSRVPPRTTSVASGQVLGSLGLYATRSRVPPRGGGRPVGPRRPHRAITLAQAGSNHQA